MILIGHQFVVRTISIFLLSVALVSQARAQLTLTFNPAAFPLASPGQHLTIQTTLTNLSGELVNFDFGTMGGTILGPGSPGMAWDDSDFILGLPSDLANGNAYIGNLYLDIDALAPLGDYTANYFVSGIGQSLAIHDSAAFAQITVSGSGGSGLVPESGGAIQFMSALLPVGIFVFRRRLRK